MPTTDLYPTLPCRGCGTKDDPVPTEHRAIGSDVRQRQRMVYECTVCHSTRSETVPPPELERGRPGLLAEAGEPMRAELRSPAVTAMVETAISKPLGEPTWHKHPTVPGALQMRSGSPELDPIRERGVELRRLAELPEDEAVVALAKAKLQLEETVVALEDLRVTLEALKL